MKKLMTVLLPLFLIVVMSSLTTSSSGAAKPEKSPDTVRETQHLTVYIDRLNLGSDGGEITVDPIQWYTGEEAEAVFAKLEPDAGIDGPPDGYYIVNEDERLEHYPVAKNTQVLMQIYDRTGIVEDAEISWNEPVTLEKLASLLRYADVFDVSLFPYHLTIENGQVTGIVQQYVP
ncbi:hypothetical protein DFP94_11162 [Fontibacillus phaseoli]|uniref:Uncharacterized protein n=1 Tax=Fontibacillus phaseoli TaxID=1416533 RepID=A0A369B5W5_9BACL|nr:hypothetical protein [Fontibacillus phaseoli]RCX16715.1 hypothetical protein DFP94_11162 [Fontibacillus phaseoli]